MNTEKRRAIFTLLKENTPNATTELVYHSPFELLISVILSAQTTDIAVNKVTKKLFCIANTPLSLSNLRVNKIEKLINSIGLYKNKAKNIQATSLKLLKEFNSTKLFKGINIASNYGSTVLSAAPGIVVYSGESLRGYGKLIIIQHGQSFLSAYAHNKEVFVKADDTVKTNQKISETGYVGLKNQYLYFEIRKKGKPVNPLIYLPKAD